LIPNTLAGFEPGIFCSWGERDDHYATPIEIGHAARAKLFCSTYQPHRLFVKIKLVRFRMQNISVMLNKRTSFLGKFGLGKVFMYACNDIYCCAFSQL
jgi:hypothetical protein